MSQITAFRSSFARRTACSSSSHSCSHAATASNLLTSTSSVNTSINTNINISDTNATGAFRTTRRNISSNSNSSTSTSGFRNIFASSHLATNRHYRGYNNKCNYQSFNNFQKSQKQLQSPLVQCATNCFSSSAVRASSSIQEHDNAHEHVNELDHRPVSAESETGADAGADIHAGAEADIDADADVNNNTIPIISEDEYDPFKVSANIHKASQWNQGDGVDGTWDPLFCAQSVNSYIDHLNYIRHYIETNNNNNNNSNSNKDSSTPENVPNHAHHLLSSSTTERALKAMLKMNIPTHVLSKKVRSAEKLIGSIGLTQLTNALSYRLLEANAKAGNVGRTIQLLNIRKSKKYTCARQQGGSMREFELAVQSIVSAGLYLRTKRNVFISEYDQPENDNPTRWLDAILVNMSSRDAPVQLSTKLANRMLDCYASTGRSGKALHFFYKVVEEKGEGVAVTVGESNASNFNGDDPVANRRSKIRMKMNSQLPPFYKLPSEVVSHNEMVKRPRREGLVSKLEWEKEKEWSPALTAAFAFADSLTHGACGHEPIELDLASWNTLIKVCCYRGAIFRALEILNNTMPRKKIEPDVITYNTILAALARMGDKNLLREMLTTMTNKGITCNKYTVKALVDGYLNAGDISGAVSLVQDVFNQQRILPPYTTHLKIIEFALGNDLTHEAKRHVYFIQQIWKWKPNTFGKDETRKFQHLMYATQRNPKLSKKSLQRLFSYFGAELLDEDFF